MKLNEIKSKYGRFPTQGHLITYGHGYLLHYIRLYGGCNYFRKLSNESIRRCWQELVNDGYAIWQIDPKTGDKKIEFCRCVNE